MRLAKMTLARPFTNRKKLKKSPIAPIIIRVYYFL